MPTLVALTCTACGASFVRKLGHVNRSTTREANHYCSKACAGLARRRAVEMSTQELKDRKRLYDLARREAIKADAALLEETRARRAAYFQRTYDRAKAAIERKARMPKHVEYCRQPHYKAYKKSYDRQYRAQKEFGEFAEAALILNDLEQEVQQRITRTEIYIINGTLNKSQERKRTYARTNGYGAKKRIVGDA